jgi:hypothetical protein
MLQLQARKLFEYAGQVEYGPGTRRSVIRDHLRAGLGGLD